MTSAKAHHYRKDFAPFDGRIWLNAASEGPLPLAAARALEKAVAWKSQPFLLDHSKFVRVVADLKESIGRLISVPPNDVILGNSASYGLHLLANGIPWREGDEILLMQNDFPTNILPWLALEDKGVKVIQIPSRENVLRPEQFIENISGRTRLFCISHVHTFTGYALEIEEFSRICREKGISLVLNISQSVGTTPVDVSRLGVDAVVAAGYKWLCGPYGTGFCWIRPQLRDRLILNQAYWIAVLSAEDLKKEGPLTMRDIKTARKFDVFGTANFFNFVPFRAAIDYWLKIGLGEVRAYHDHLLDRLVDGLKDSRYDFVSPRQGRDRSSLAVISHRDRNKNEKIHQELLSRGVYTALWKGNIRIAPHVYNTDKEIAQLIKLLNRLGGR